MFEAWKQERQEGEGARLRVPLPRAARLRSLCYLGLEMNCMCSATLTCLSLGGGKQVVHGEVSLAGCVRRTNGVVSQVQHLVAASLS